MSVTVSGTVGVSVNLLTQNPLTLFKASGSINTGTTVAPTFSNHLYTATLTANTTTTIDLTSGLTDVFNQALDFSTGGLKCLYVFNNAVSSTLTVGGGSNAVFSAMPAIPAQSTLCLGYLTGITVDGTHKNILFTSSSGSVSFNVIVAG